MVTRRRVHVFASITFAIFSAVLFAQGKAPDKAPQPRKLTDAEKKEILTIQKMIDSGQEGPDDLSLTWMRDDLMKAQGSQQYVPFTVLIDPAKVSGNKLSFYWRVAPKADAAAAAPAAAKKDDKSDKNAKSDYLFEDLSTITLTPGQAGPLRISRSLTVTAGDYDVYVVVKEPTPEKPQKNAPPPRTSMMKHPLTVQNLWSDELTTSSVIVTERVDPIPAALTPQQQSERPYALGAMELVPAPSTKFTKKGELSTFVLIYNTKTDSANKPDVTVEYNFYAKQAGGEKFFNKTNPESLNAQTLPPQFDFNAGHQLQSGQAVPLASFPEGEYRLEIKITDKIANKTVTRDVNFSVSGS